MRHSSITLPLALSLLSGFISLGAIAQALPGAGQVGKQERPIFTNPGAGMPTVAEPINAPATAPPMTAPMGNAKLPIKGFRFVGNHIYTSEQLEKELQITSLEGGISFDDLTRAVDRIGRLYRVAGYNFARAYVPAQTSPDDFVQINVLEGRHAERILENTSAVKSEVINGIAQETICQEQRANCIGAIAMDDNNERLIRLLNDLPGTVTGITLVPGKATGTTSLKITAKPSTYPASVVGIDNYGSKATGLYRVNVGTDFNNLRGVGDQLSLAGSTSSAKIWSGSATYSVLASNTGVRAGVSFGHGQYLLGDSFAALDAHGESNSFGVFVSDPIIRHREHNLTLRASLDGKVLKDVIGVTSTQYDKRALTYNFSAYGDYVDNLGGGGYNTFNASLIGGTIRLLDANSQANDAAAKTAGGYEKITFGASRQQAIAGAWTLYGAVNGQTGLRNKNLDGSEKMGLGGSGGVRGYPAGEGGGDKGAVANLELRNTQAFGGDNATITYSAFVDRGWSKANIVPWTGITTTTRAITGYGLGVMIIKPFDYTVRALYGTHKAGEPSLLVPDSRHQLWLQASKSF